LTLSNKKNYKGKPNSNKESKESTKDNMKSRPKKIYKKKLTLKIAKITVQTINQARKSRVKINRKKRILYKQQQKYKELNTNKIAISTTKLIMTISL
jgi:hypothetical protein